MNNKLWKFIDDKGTFTSDEAYKINTLYLPLCNSLPIMSSISPDLHGDIKTDFNSFLLEPVSRINLSSLKSSRNFWLYINPKKIWSATGVCKDIFLAKNDLFHLEAGLLWQKISRQNKKIGLKADITSFIPAQPLEPVEIMYVKITNISRGQIKFIPTAAIPIYGRSANNLRDHRHVTSLLNRIEIRKNGVILTPTLIFDESGHRKNNTSYFVFGIDENSCCPEYIYPIQEEFTSDASDLEAPRAVFENIPPDKKMNIQGKEAMGGLKFAPRILRTGESRSFIILMGITKEKNKINAIFNKFNSPDKIKRSLNNTIRFWQDKISAISLNTGDTNFDNWFRWVSIQPILRRIFGCSFLPDFDYGKGGRGWRDLWQDCLSLILGNPLQVRDTLINNFKGVRIDGSNATIIGQKPGEFIADRNNISRVWMDHGVWPLITTHLYIHQSGDLNILFKEIPYFKDRQLSRGTEIDLNYNEESGKELKTKNQQVYKGSVLEHLLVQNLVQFFNVGPHNHIRLENADWNDGLDMAAQQGESVAFTSFYAQNLNSLCEILENIKDKRISILKEITMLLDSIGTAPINYSDINAKHRILNKYFNAVKYSVSGKKITLPTKAIIRDLKKKADWIFGHIQKTEWLKEGFFNGYYDNLKRRVEGRSGNIIRMTLTGQVFAIMSGLANKRQIGIIFKNVQKYLKDKTLGGFRLNTDFKKEQLNLGRAFSFSYGDKENGAFFNHMAVMFAYALYKQGFVNEGYEVLNSIYKMACDTKRSKIYPCLPEYFNAEGRGMYSYLTGSASWFILTLLTQVFGIRGEYGNLVIEPKLTQQQFKATSRICITTSFADKVVEISFINPRKKDFGQYTINKICFNGKEIVKNMHQGRFLILRKTFLTLADKQHNVIEVTLD